MTGSVFRRLLPPALTIGYAIFCFFAVTVLSIQDTDWMIGETDRDGTAFTACTVPAPGDDTSDVAIPVSLLLIAGLLLPGLFSLVRRRRVGAPLLLGTGLLLYGAALLFGRKAFC